MNERLLQEHELSLELEWMRCWGDVWCKLNLVNLNHEYFNSDISGVYIIWHGGTDPKVVYVGKGKIKDRIMKHRQNPDIQRYEHLGLYVTWAKVSENYRGGVEAYLADKWGPIVGERHPDAPPIKVNSPWSS